MDALIVKESRVALRGPTSLIPVLDRPVAPPDADQNGRTPARVQGTEGGKRAAEIMNIKPIVAIIGVGLMVSGLACCNTKEPRPRCFPLGPEIQPYFVGGVEQDAEGLYVKLELELPDGFAEGSQPDCSVHYWASATVREVDNPDMVVEIIQSVESISKQSYVIRLTDNASDIIVGLNELELTFTVSEVINSGIDATELKVTVEIGPAGNWTVKEFETSYSSYV